MSKCKYLPHTHIKVRPIIAFQAKSPYSQNNLVFPKGRPVLLSLCSRTKKILKSCPAITSSQDKGSTKNPWTKLSVPGQNHYLIGNYQKMAGTGQDRLSKSCLGPSCGNILSLSLCPGTMKEHLSLCSRGT